MVFILFILGAVVGSFLNVVGLRWDLPAGRQALSKFGGRSMCPNCKKILKWWELIPFISFLALRAKCGGCKASISWQYPAVEILTGLVFATIFNFQFSILQNLILITVFSIYIVITIYDLKHKIIPDELVYAAIFLSLLIPIFFIHYSLLDWLSGPIIFAFFGLIWLISRGRAMGFGDAKLGLSIGLLLGAPLGFSAIILAFWIGALISVIYLFFNKNLTIKSEIPFAPFIIMGAWISLIFHLDILHVTLF